MSVVDLATFSEKGFSAKSWINGVCTQKPAEQAMDKYIAELEMKLQLLAEDISVSLEDHSTQALQRIPRAVKEVSRLKDDGVKLSGSIGGILTKLEHAESTSKGSVELLSSVDSVKKRMESARDTLKEASGMAELMESVEQVFAGTDLKLMASTLSRMRRGLKVVGNVPEFKYGRERVAALEDRLEAVVSPALSEALSNHNAEKARELRDLLVSIGRYSAVEVQYTNGRLQPLLGLWEQYEGGLGGGGGSSASFVDWLPTFYDAVLLHLATEHRWCAAVFPEHQSALLVHLVGVLLERTFDAFVHRLQDALQEAQAAGARAESDIVAAAAAASGGALGALLAAHTSACVFAKGLRELLTASEAKDAEVARVLQRVFAPFEEHKRQYGELERRQLVSEVGAIDLVESSDLEDTVQRMSSAIPAVRSLLEGAVDRCLHFTGGTEVEALLHALDEVLLQFVGSLSALLKHCTRLCGVSAEGPAGPDPPEGEDAGPPAPDLPGDEVAQGALQLLAVSGALLAQLGAFEVVLRNALVELGQRMGLVIPLAKAGDAAGLGPAGALGLEAAYVRLLGEPEKAARLASLLDQVADARFHALPRAAPHAATFQDAVHTLVYEVLLARCRPQLRALHTLPDWTAQEPASAFHLPTFSAYPKEYVTAVGEYLLTLPQQLEALTLGGGAGSGAGEGEEADDTSFFASSWLTKVATGAAQLYTEELLKIPCLSDKGAQQVAADVEYLCNVYAALGEVVPPALSSFMKCTMLGVDDYTRVTKEDAEDLDAAVVAAVAKMRAIKD